MRITERNPDIREETLRVFFAIWPGDVARVQLSGLAEQLRGKSFCSGRKTKTENIHLTLVFVGEVGASKLDALYRVADEIKDSGMSAFDFVVEKIRYWKRNRIVYATTGGIPPELTGLVSTLECALSTAGFVLEQRTYKPHITLMRDALCQTLPELAEPIAWQVREWMLVKSEQTSGGSVYTPIGRWPLGI
ncbi:RNA 2',3'-cyclic phosphodiesterase [Nitrosospira lacus]|uniref:RNA 2',3'-cyclic phosphodiesterase n=1 Tax=Nitrosospira lacus TaxID=1288494 RepID=A0A1W6SSC5_9PROT|nr:RNA 2',3'-cyclic phosphodiesterase [Nitrosospira lacus]ARO88718.1 RNA 2',3'-cyclic phosphodiesterase [Nitrosospira lacus]